MTTIFEDLGIVETFTMSHYVRNTVNVLHSYLDEF